MPLVSIVIPTYNRADLIGETIQSVIDQTYKNWELIIVDDGSSDQTDEVVQRFADPRIQYYEIDHAGAFGVVRNHGIKKSKGEFLAFLDSDDLWLPDKLFKQVTLLRSSEATFVFTNIELFGETKVVVPDLKDIYNDKLLSRYLEEGHFAFYPSTLMFKKSALTTTGLMNESLQTGADTELFLNLCHHFTGSFLSARLAKIRKHKHNTSSADIIFSYPETVALMHSVYKKGYLSTLLYKATVSKLYYKMGLLLSKNKQHLDSFRCFLNYFYFRPLHWKGWIRLVQVPVLFLLSSLSRSK